MARFKQTDPRAQRPRKRSASAGLILPSDNSDDESHMQPTTLPTPTSSLPPPTMPDPSKTTFQRQRSNDRSAIKIAVANAIARNQASFLAMPVTERWEFIRREREKKLGERERKGNGSARGMFPGEWDERGEGEWLWRGFVGFLGRQEKDKGMERKGKGGISYAESSDEEDGDESDEDDEEEVRGPVKREDEGQDGDEEADVEMADVLPQIPNGHQHNDKLADYQGSPRRMWRAIDGAMSICPPSEDSEQVEFEGNLAREAIRRVARTNMLESAVSPESEERREMSREECVAQ